MSQTGGVSKPSNTLDNLVHGFVESVGHEHEHQIDHLKDTPSFAAGNVNELTQQTESSFGQRIHVPQIQQLTSLKEDQFLEETATTRFSDFSFLPERSTIAQSAKSLIIDSYELANDTLAVVRVPPKSKRLFSAALLVANATHRSVNSLTSDSGSKDTLSTVKETKPLAFPVGFNETVIACAPAAVTNLKKQKKSRGTSRLNAVLKETSEEDTFDSVDHRFKMIQRRLDRISPKRMHTCRDSDSGCSVDDPLMYDKFYTVESGVRDNLNNIIELANLNSESVQHYSKGESEDGDSDIEEEVIRNEIFQEDIFADIAVVDHLIETKMTDQKKKHVPKKKNKKKNNQIFPTPMSLFRKKMHTKLDAEVEKRERFMKEYLRVATLSAPHVVVVVYCRWNPRMSVVCGQTTDLIIYTMKAFFTTNSGLHVNWIHSPEDKFERLIERGARLKFYKDYPENVRGVLALSRDASILVKNPQSSLLCSLCELLEINRHELAVVEVKDQ